MGKRLSIKGHPTRGKEVIELLKMMGGKNFSNIGNDDELFYYIDDKNNIDFDCTIWDINDRYTVFTLEEFLEKYPFKIGDKVIDKADGCPGIVNEMKWDEDVSDMKYFVAFGNDIDFGWFANDSIEFCKETDTVKPVTNKSERTHEDVIFDSIIWHLRNSVNNGKQNLSGGECEDYFREVVKKNNENKMSDCKKCGLGFGSVRCFDKDCPHNTPKSYAVGLKDGKVIDCIANKETDMNENKPLFKTGDVVKLKGCPDKNFFWIVMDVIEDGYIFNGGEKCSFDDQHHYEKSNREVINMTKETFTPAPDITANITDKNNCDIACPDGYEFYDENGNLIGNKVMMRPKKPKYPKLTNLSECKEILGEKDMYQGVSGYKGELLTNFQRLLIFRDVYWKMAGEKMGLDKPWEPDWTDLDQLKYCIWVDVGEFITMINVRGQHILAFPTEEMRDAFYENFKDLIEQCKELL